MEKFMGTRHGARGWRAGRWSGRLVAGAETVCGWGPDGLAGGWDPKDRNDSGRRAAAEGVPGLLWGS